MAWYGTAPHPGVCELHASPQEKGAATAALDIPVDVATADPATVFPNVSITPQQVICDSRGGWVAKIRGTHAKYVYARTFLERDGIPYAWRLSGNGLYECREIGPHNKFSCFFEVRGVFRRRVQLVTPERAARIAKIMGPKASEA
ncbi:hypothetical protein [Streptomyces sp. NPDC051014]|uniref:hypothetical protein n=1 Tax=Streptomyces sp. NPDC051014 TaxID=3155751 RepID=UPI0033DF601A